MNTVRIISEIIISEIFSLGLGNSTSKCSPAAFSIADIQPLGKAGAAMVRERYAQDVTLPQLAMLFDRLASANK